MNDPKDIRKDFKKDLVWVWRGEGAPLDSWLSEQEKDLEKDLP